jgi:hypothetical protein
MTARAYGCTIAVCFLVRRKRPNAHMNQPVRWCALCRRRIPALAQRIHQHVGIVSVRNCGNLHHELTCVAR